MTKYRSRNGKREHRLVWEEAYGPIPEGYHIHHKNGDGLDNDLDNLELLSASDHVRRHKLGWRHSDETRAKMSQAQSTPEAVALKSKTHRGRKQSVQQVTRRQAAMVDFYNVGGSLSRMTPEERSEFSRRAARARWGKKEGD